MGRGLQKSDWRQQHKPHRLYRETQNAFLVEAINAVRHASEHLGCQAQEVEARSQEFKVIFTYIMTGVSLGYFRPYLKNNKQLDQY